VSYDKQRDAATRRAHRRRNSEKINAARRAAYAANPEQHRKDIEARKLAKQSGMRLRKVPGEDAYYLVDTALNAVIDGPYPVDDVISKLSSD
jgi:hypothetical protein